VDEIFHRSLSEQTYDILKRHIIERELKPNSKIDLNELSQRLGVSRMPIVEAIARLEREGLVIRRNRVGTYISPLTAEIFSEMFAARQMIEEWMVPHTLKHLTPHDLDALEAELTQASLLLRAEDDQSFDYRRYSEHDERFHLILVERCNNRQVYNFYTSLNSHVQIARVYSHRALDSARQDEAEHAAILEAYRAGDVAAARAAQNAHLERNRIQLLALIEQHGVL
jgi:DNA-binding GntR family transcriptional regulator